MSAVVFALLLATVPTVLSANTPVSGCYSPTTHKCDCTTTQTWCTAPNMWLASCSCTNYDFLLQGILEVPRVSKDNCLNIAAIRKGHLKPKSPVPASMNAYNGYMKYNAVRAMPLLNEENCQKTYNNVEYVKHQNAKHVPFWPGTNIYSSTTAGCYSLVTHTCACHITSAASCSYPNIWSGTGCAFTQCPTAAAPAASGSSSSGSGGASSSASSGAAASTNGCYSTTSHTCDCSVSQAACASPNLWTSGCTSCAGR